MEGLSASTRLQTLVREAVVPDLVAEARLTRRQVVMEPPTESSRSPGMACLPSRCIHRRMAVGVTHRNKCLTVHRPLKVNGLLHFSCGENRCLTVFRISGSSIVRLPGPATTAGTAASRSASSGPPSLLITRELHSPLSCLEKKSTLNAFLTTFQHPIHMPFSTDWAYCGYLLIAKRCADFGNFFTSLSFLVHAPFSYGPGGIFWDAVDSEKLVHIFTFI